jgi:hypothetical protein
LAGVRHTTGGAPDGSGGSNGHGACAWISSTAELCPVFVLRAACGSKRLFSLDQDRNRALQGDVVALQLLEKEKYAPAACACGAAVHMVVVGW